MGKPPRDLYGERPPLATGPIVGYSKTGPKSGSESQRPVFAQRSQGLRRKSAGARRNWAGRLSAGLA